MKARLLLLIFLILTCALIAQPHPVYVEVHNAANEIPEEGDIHFEAWLTDNPGEILTEDSTDCYFPAFGSFVKVNCGQFGVFDIGDILHLEVWELSTNDWGWGEYELNYEASQFYMIDEGGIMLMDELAAPELELPQGFETLEDEILTVDFSEYITNTCYFLRMVPSENIHAEINSLSVTLIPDLNWCGFEVLYFTARGWGGIEDSSEVLFWAQPVNDAPVVYDLEPEESEVEITEGEEVLFAAAVQDIDSEVNYLWQINESQVGGDQCSYLHQFNEGGEFEIILTISDEEYDQEVNWTVNVNSNGNEHSEVISNPIELFGNYPNPFNPETTIRYSLISGISDPELEIYNLKGQKVETINLSLKGSSYTWNGRNNSSGVYFYRIRSDQYITKPKSMILLK
ncbi:MAG: T9SS type A sorting domain-containing protein [Candidatus Stygibacter australis]|nr:T9SS type A sorting domain-containing protein [Candidatus Stygibacter australis]MDP8323051.1 T9SS type A sorting domain-containing protein [Candidatus Stygibacter australis]